MHNNIYFSPVYDTDEITSSGSNAEGGQLALTCRMGLRGKLNQLLPFIQLQWIEPSGVALTTNNDVHIGLQEYSSDETSLTLTINPLSIAHSGVSFPSQNLHLFHSLSENIAMSVRLSVS